VFRNQKQNLLFCVQDAGRSKLHYAAMVSPGRGNRSWNCQLDVLPSPQLSEISPWTNTMKWHYYFQLRVPAKNCYTGMTQHGTPALVPDHPEPSNVVIGASMDGTAGAVPLFRIIMYLYLTCNSRD